MDLTKKPTYNDQEQRNEFQEQVRVFFYSRTTGNIEPGRRQPVRQFFGLASAGHILLCLIFAATGGIAQATAQMVYEPFQLVQEQKEDVVNQDPRPIHQRILEYREIAPNLESIRQYLQELHPDHPSQAQLSKRATGLINNLGDDNYQIRVEARRELARMTSLPIEQLKRARKSGDPEVRASIALLLRYERKRSARDSRDGITQAVCSTIVELEMKGLVEELLRTYQLFEGDEYTLSLVRKAIVASVVKGDVDTLKVLATGKDQQLRLVGIAALAESQYEGLEEYLKGFVDDGDEHVRLQAARMLANAGYRDSIEVLADLMESEDLKIRMGSHRALRAFTGQDFKFYAFESDEKRLVATKKWTDWIAENAATVELKFPLVEGNIVLGRILLSDYSANKVVELDMDGKEVWSKTISNPWAVEGLPNGNRLIGLYEESSIVELDSEGNEVSKISGIPGNAMGFCRLDNGNTLVAGSSSGKILEYDTEGKVVWENDIGSRPTDIKMMPNGNLLVALMDQSRIVIVNREGERLKEITTETNPLSVQVTERGTFITAHSGMQHANEYNIDGEVVRKYEVDVAVTGAREMTNGDWVIATSDSVHRRTAEGKIVWEFKNLTYCYNVAPY